MQNILISSKLMLALVYEMRIQLNLLYLLFCVMPYLAEGDIMYIFSIGFCHLLLFVKSLISLKEAQQKFNEAQQNTDFYESIESHLMSNKNYFPLRFTIELGCLSVPHWQV